MRTKQAKHKSEIGDQFEVKLHPCAKPWVGGGWREAGQNHRWVEGGEKPAKTIGGWKVERTRPRPWVGGERSAKTLGG